MGYFNFYFLKKLLNKLFTKKTLFYIIIFLFIIILKSNVFAVDVETSVDNVDFEIFNESTMYQNNFAYFAFYPYYGNTEFWTGTDNTYGLVDVIELMSNEQYLFYIDQITVNSDIMRFEIYFYRPAQRDNRILSNYNSRLNNIKYLVDFEVFNTGHYLHYRVDFNSTNNSGSVTSMSNGSTLKVPTYVAYYKSDAILEFIKLYKTGSYGSDIDYTSFLNTINNYLGSIDTVNGSILTLLNTISQNLSVVSQNTSTNYSQQIGQISSKISDILDDNSTIINQNSQMIQQQEAINDNLDDVNDNLQQVSSDIQDVKETINDDTVESSASDLPSTNVNNPTENGIDNIFQSIYNAFCVGEAQDIVFPIPFTNKNITLSPYYVRDMLNTYGASWVYLLIQAFWGYLIGRYIISDISKKIDKIKSGNIENVENSNIKEEML